MSQTDFFIHSPFSPFLMDKEENKALLLQFILSELFLSAKCSGKGIADSVFSSHPVFYPYDWSQRRGCFNKIQEHGVLLGCAFESFSEPLSLFNSALEQAISSVDAKQGASEEITKLFISLFPFIESLKYNENLLFFLLKSHKELSEMNKEETGRNFFLRLYPEGLLAMQDIIQENYQKRGMNSILSNVKIFLEELHATSF